MIDSKVFAELQNRGIITNVGLNPNDFKNIDELQNLGYATSIAADPVYDKLVEELVDVAAKKQAFLEAIKNGGTVTVDMDYLFEYQPIQTHHLQVLLYIHFHSHKAVYQNATQNNRNLFLFLLFYILYLVELPPNCELRILPHS